MLVYLDSGDLANLERLLARTPTEFDEFIAGWVARDCTLALSMHHAQEIRQLADDRSREARLSFLERFPAIRYEPGGSHKVVTFEAMVQVLARLSQQPPDYARDVSLGLFQERGLGGLKSTVFELGDSLDALQRAQRTTADVRNTTRGSRLPHSYRKQTREKIDLVGAREALQAALANEELPAAARGAMKVTFKALSGTLESSGNLRAAFEQAYGLEGYDCIRATDDYDLHRVVTFFSVAREAIGEYAADLGAPVDECLALLPRLDPYDCPGTRIEMAVSRAQDASTMVAESSDEPDRAHVSFLPYVDVMFADRRTVGFFQQEAKSARRNEALRQFEGRLRKSAPSDALLSAIDASQSNAA